jgi:hypothetical protein
MPIILRVHYADNSNEILKIPAEIWRSNGTYTSKLLITDKEIVRLELDPKQETADTESSNNHWPPRLVPSRFRLFKDGPSRNPMQKAGLGKKTDEQKATEKDKADTAASTPKAKSDGGKKSTPKARGENGKKPAAASAKPNAKAKPKTQ